jgi:hypothetical protein
MKKPASKALDTAPKHTSSKSVKSSKSSGTGNCNFSGEGKASVDNSGRIKPGEVRNPFGRPKGSRHRLTEAFIEAMCEDFEANGVEAIKACRVSSPETYLSVLVRLMPKQHEVSIESRFEAMSDEELDGFIAEKMQAVGHVKAK